MRTIQIAFVGLVAATAGAEPPVVAIRQDPRSVDVGAWILEKVPQPRSVYEALLARGVTQHVQLDKTHIPMALALQAAGSPVIVMEGQGERWPATLAGDVSLWGHRFDPGYPAPRPVLPCLMWLDGWAAAGKRVRETLLAFRQAGVTIDAVWMDWEGDPMSDWKSPWPMRRSFASGAANTGWIWSGPIWARRSRRSTPPRR